MFLFYSHVNHAVFPSSFFPFVTLQMLHDLPISIPYHLHFKFGVQKACCFSICILLFLFIHTTAHLYLCMYVCMFVCLFVCSFFYSFFCASLSTQFISVYVWFSIPVHISIITVVPHYQLGSFAYPGFRHSS
jgi:hypothetical protein